MIIEILPLLMFLVLAALLFTGFPVAFVLGGVGLAFWLLAVALGIENPLSFFLVVGRIFGGVVDNLTLVAIPMFIFMGTLLEKSGVARDLLSALQVLTRKIPGGLALSVTLIGVVMAATTGIIGASVVMMTVLALPVMIDRGYDKALASGTIAASGTLGILVPPSIMLVVMADLLSTSVGGLFMAALLPGLLLSTLYLLWIIARTAISPQLAPALPKSEGPRSLLALSGLMIRSFLLPVLLIALVLGSIFGGYATPTEASGIGAAGALVLALLRKNFRWKTFLESLDQSTLTSAMLFGIFVGATAFSYVFALLGGHDLIVGFVDSLDVGPWGILFVLMAIVFILGFFFDWIEITLIVLPVFAPVIKALDFAGHVPFPELTITWFAVLVAVNLQTSFLTPPFGFALFYLKGVAPRSVRIQHIYKGVIPFIILQILALGAVMAWPDIALWLPSRMQ
ncbi:C4-dicarboxylate ABC transporter [Iodidimonas gelatinilytica]|uniref:TRAP transporter large permease protein n=1 Tax=Iodidimonas gelatinilytica TaxID=1236966 RepID=A0A5A7N220_9PROT|nr:TRAP transporter large permease subunit [Iodidimonas gelatinilytica]GER01199.1 C4-dicarboxylate ABC transporter [Iodidimonas gelatinilytica]